MITLQLNLRAGAPRFRAGLGSGGNEKGAPLVRSRHPPVISFLSGPEYAGAPLLAPTAASVQYRSGLLPPLRSSTPPALSSSKRPALDQLATTSGSCGMKANEACMARFSKGITPIGPYCVGLSRRPPRA
jgi:hypothetical protein